MCSNSNHLSSFKQLHLKHIIMKKISTLLLSVIFFLTAALTSFAQKEVHKTFSPKEKISISTVSGDCMIKKGGNDEIKVKLIYTYSDDCFEYSFKEDNNSLMIKEEFNGRNCNGESECIITTPSNVNIKFNTASGDLELNGVDNSISASTASGDMELKNVGKEVDISTASGDIKLENINGNSIISTASGNITAKNCVDGIKLSTASGNIDLEDINGKISLSAASGDITIINASGEFKVKTASGNIEAENIELTDESYLGAASGDVEVSLSKSAVYDLTISSASGNSILDYNGNDIKGFFEFSARKDKGAIFSPIKFDKEEVVEKNGKDYDVKSFTAGSDNPEIIIKTASGKAQLKK